MLSTPTASTTADLGEYISSNHHPPSRCAIPPRIFDQGLTHRRPRLHLGRVNRILLYPGCFNPPHIAHERLLSHAFAGTQDLNVIAAIVLPLDGARVADKCSRADPLPLLIDSIMSGGRARHLVLSEKQRVWLWNGGWERTVVPHDWRWAYDGAEAEWEGFRARLVAAVEPDGFELEFVCLVGADYVSRGVPFPWDLAWDCKGIVVGEVGRRANFVSGDLRGKLEPLVMCEKWGVVEEDEKETYERAMDVVAWYAGAMSVLSPDTLKRELDKGRSHPPLSQASHLVC
jgi:hypothetical protein